MRLLRIWVIVLIALFGRESLACDASDTTSLGSVNVSIGLFDAVFNGGDWAAAAYGELGEVLDRRFGSQVSSGRYHVYFVCTISALGYSGTNSVHVCFTKESGQTFEQAVDTWLEDQRSGNDAGGLGYSPHDYDFYDPTGGPLIWDNGFRDPGSCTYQIYCDQQNPLRP